MTGTSRKRQAFQVSVAVAVVIVAAFVPWGKVDFSRMPAPFGGEIGEGFNQMIASFGTVPVTVWNGHADIGGVKLPNVLVLFAAAAAALVSWLRAFSVGNLPAAVSIALSGYGLAHSGYVLLYLLISVEGSAGLGVFLTTLAFAWMLVALVRRERPKDPVQNQPLQQTGPA